MVSRDEDVYARAVELAPVERDAFLERACGGDDGLRARVEALLIGNVEAEGFFESPVLGARPAPMPEEKPGDRIGRYKLLQKIGEGGCGVVYMAEQEEPVRRRVALKVIKLGMDTKAVIARFEAERQALALMDHPNIARVLDAGATETGRPFFVMELVGGIPITRYCDEENLSTGARLGLFVQVCHAIQHAHHKAIVHRDIKPSNILVAVHDGSATPKVIDFGIAKATQGRLTDQTVFTAFEQFIGTPAYMSPEQTQLGGIDVDTRSDIYSLGVLLYELLTGRPPFDPKTLREAGIDEIRRIIREVEPPRPSTRLTTLAAADRDAVARSRGTAPAQLSLLLRGDLDWIVMKALEKNRARRYETANGLASDIKRHLANEPVIARPPSAAYRFEKLLSRHKLAFGAGAAIAVSLVAGLTISTILFFRAKSAGERAVLAERAQHALRKQAESAREVEARRSSQTALALAEQLFREDGRTSEGLAYLVRAARTDPSNYVVGPRLVSVLGYNNFAAPIGVPLLHPAAIAWLHPASHSGARYTPDGRHAVTWADDFFFRYWELESGELLQAIDIGEFVSTDLSQDGRHVAVASVDGTVRVWAIATGEMAVGPLRHPKRVDSIRFSADGRWLGAGCSDQTTRIWEVATGELKTVIRHDAPVFAIAFNPNGRQVFTATYQSRWRLWNVIDGTPDIPEKGWSRAAYFSPDGALIAVSENFGVQLYDTTTGAKVGTHLAHDGASIFAAFTRDGKKIVTTSEDSTARLWEVHSGKPLLPPMKHGGRPNTPFLALGDRYLITSSYDRKARVWDLRSGRLALDPIRLGDILGVDLSPDGTEFMTSGRSDRTVRRWRIAPEAMAPIRLANRLQIRPDLVAPGQAWILHRDRLQKIELRTGRDVELRLFPTHIVDGNLAPDGRHALVRTGAGDVEIWDIGPTDTIRRRIGRLSLAIKSAQFSEDSSRFAVGVYQSPPVVRVWDTQTGAALARPFMNARGIFSLSSDGRKLAAGASETSAAIWDVATGERIGAPLNVRGRLYGVELSRDGRWAASTSEDSGVQLWDLASTQPVGPLLQHRNHVRGALFTRDSRRLLTWTPLETRVWDVASFTPIIEPIAAGNDLQSAAFNGDETCVVTLSRAGDARIWDSSSGQMMVEPIQLGGAFVKGGYHSFLSTGKFLAAATAGRGNSSVISLWPMPELSGRHPAPEWLLRLATAAAGGEIDTQATFRERPIDAQAFGEIRRELAALPDDGLYVEWGRWFLAERATRSIGPGFTITAAEAEKLVSPPPAVSQ